MSADTLIPNQANPQSWDRYSYVRNNPVRYTDPTGHMEYEGNDGRPGVQNCKKDPTYCNKWGRPSSSQALNLWRILSTTNKGSGVCFMCKPSIDSALPADYTLPTSQTIPSTQSTDALYPVKKEFHWGAVDWWDVGINVAGIAGDIALGSTTVGDLAGPEVWLATEGVEIVGIMRDEYDGDYDALRKDGLGKAVQVLGDLKQSAMLAPAFGFVFNLSNIADAFQDGYVDVPNYGPYAP